MRKKILILLICALSLLAARQTNAAREDGLSENGPKTAYQAVSPRTAVISPQGARLAVSQKVEIREQDGKNYVEFALPPDASSLQLAIPGHTISRWSSSPVMLNEGSQNVGRRAKIEKRHTELTAQLMTVNARLALWQALPQNASAAELENLQAAMSEAMPQLVLRQSDLEKQLKLVNEELARMPQGSGLGELVQVVLADKAKAGEEAEINYSYQHDGCGWEAVYDFNAMPDEGSGDEIDVRLLAEVWQFTGINWNDTKITLATRGYGPREPRPLPEWIVDSQQRRPEPRAMLKAAAPMAAIEAQNDAVPATAGVAVNTEAVYATWTLAETGLPQGRSRLQITAAAWKAPLQWLARPSRDSSQVWLEAKYNLPSDQAWPAGQAQYNVNGQSVGNGYFQPKSGEATLFFGADPRVNVTTTNDSQKRGKSGFINTSNNWSWAWTYTITNQHNKPVKVRVERPAPIIVDKDVTVAYDNVPKAVEDPKKHILTWEVTAPANGKIAIQHDITITSPSKLPLLPDIP